MTRARKEKENTWKARVKEEVVKDSKKKE